MKQNTKEKPKEISKYVLSSNLIDELHNRKKGRIKVSENAKEKAKHFSASQKPALKILKTAQGCLSEKYLNDFAQRNQYSSWKEVIKDKQQIGFSAKEFEDEIKEAISSTQSSCEEKIKELEKQLLFYNEIYEPNVHKTEEELRCRISVLMNEVEKLQQENKELKEYKTYCGKCQKHKKCVVMRICEDCFRIDLHKQQKLQKENTELRNQLNVSHQKRTELIELNNRFQNTISELKEQIEIMKKSMRKKYNVLRV